MKKHLRTLGAVLLVALAIAIPALAEASFSNVILTTRVGVAMQAGAYSAGNCLAAAQTIPGVIRPGGGGGTTIVSVALTDPAHQTAANNAQTLWIFNAAPTGTYTQGSACALAAADRAAFLGSIVIASTDCVLDSGTTTSCTKLLTFPASAIPLPNPSGTQNLWFVPVITATPTYGSATVTYIFNTQPN